MANVNVKTEGNGNEARSIVEVSGWTLVAWTGSGEEEPRVRDIDLAERLGYERPRTIRDLINRLIAAGKLNDSDVRRTVRRTQVGAAERDIGEMWLTEAQALKVIAKSETQKADAMLDEMIEVYKLARRGLLPQQQGIDPAFNARLAKIEDMVLELHRGLTKTRHRSPSVKSGDLFPTELEHAPLVAALADVIDMLGGSATAKQLEKVASEKATAAAIALDQHLRQWVPAMARETWTMRLGRLFRRMATWEATRHGKVFKVDGAGESVRWSVGFPERIKMAG